MKTKDKDQENNSLENEQNPTLPNFENRFSDLFNTAYIFVWFLIVMSIEACLFEGKKTKTFYFKFFYTFLHSENVTILHALIYIGIYLFWSGHAFKVRNNHKPNEDICSFK